MTAVAGLNLYRVEYPMPPTRGIFQKLVVAASEEDARAMIHGASKCELVESDISMLIPDSLCINSGKTPRECPYCGSEDLVMASRVYGADVLGCLKCGEQSTHSTDTDVKPAAVPADTVDGYANRLLRQLAMTETYLINLGCRMQTILKAAACEPVVRTTAESGSRLFEQWKDLVKSGGDDALKDPKSNLELVPTPGTPAAAAADSDRPDPADPGRAGGIHE